MKIDHIGIVVKDLNKGILQWCDFSAYKQYTKKS